MKLLIMTYEAPEEAPAPYYETPDEARRGSVVPYETMTKAKTPTKAKTEIKTKTTTEHKHKTPMKRKANTMKAMKNMTKTEARTPMMKTTAKTMKATRQTKTKWTTKTWRTANEAAARDIKTTKTTNEGQYGDDDEPFDDFQQDDVYTSDDDDVPSHDASDISASCFSLEAPHQDFLKPSFWQ